MRYEGDESHGNASEIWRVIHSVVGWLVAPTWINRRRPWRNTTNPKRNLNPIVGTTKKSIAVVPSAWFFRNVFQDCDGGLRRRTMYFATVDRAISMPNFSSSPWIQGAPYNGLSRLISRMRFWMSLRIRGLPGTPRDFQRQKARKLRRCQRTTVSGRTIATASNRLGNSRQTQSNTARSPAVKRNRLVSRRRRIFT